MTYNVLIGTLNPTHSPTHSFHLFCSGLDGTKMFTFWILLEQRMMEVVPTAGAVRRAKLQSNCHHQQTNNQLFTGRSPLSPPLSHAAAKSRVVWYSGTGL